MLPRVWYSLKVKKWTELSPHGQGKLNRVVSPMPNPSTGGHLIHYYSSYRLAVCHPFLVNECCLSHKVKKYARHAMVEVDQKCLYGVGMVPLVSFRFWVVSSFFSRAACGGVSAGLTRE